MIVLRVVKCIYLLMPICFCFQVAPLVIDSLLFDNKDLLLVMTDVLSHFVKTKHMVIADSTQTILPRLLVLTKYVKSMVSSIFLS